MIKKEEARKIALQWINKLDAKIKLILLEHTIDTKCGWVFFYDSEEHHLTGKISSMLLGNAPILVDFLGNVHVTGTKKPLKDYIYDLEYKCRFSFKSNYKE